MVEAMSKAKPNQAHLLFEKHLKELGLDFERECRFHATRKWRLDYVLYAGEHATKPEHLSRIGIAVEIEGAIWVRGRHTRGKGYQADLDKYNAATMSGYRVLRFSTDDVMRGRAKAFLKEHLAAPQRPERGAAK
jgi:hypothetical protein